MKVLNRVGELMLIPGIITVFLLALLITVSVSETGNKFFMYYGMSGMVFSGGVFVIVLKENKSRYASPKYIPLNLLMVFVFMSMLLTVFSYIGG